jgi:hypothetical protein
MRRSRQTRSILRGYTGPHLSEQRTRTDTEGQRDRHTQGTYSYIELVGSRLTKSSDLISARGT